MSDDWMLDVYFDKGLFMSFRVTREEADRVYALIREVHNDVGEEWIEVTHEGGKHVTSLGVMDIIAASKRPCPPPEQFMGQAIGPGVNRLTERAKPRIVE